jgi:hypothetical protein
MKPTPWLPSLSLAFDCTVPMVQVVGHVLGYMPQLQDLSIDPMYLTKCEDTDESLDHLFGGMYRLRLLTFPFC